MACINGGMIMCFCYKVRVSRDSKAGFQYWQVGSGLFCTELGEKLSDFYFFYFFWLQFFLESLYFAVCGGEYTGNVYPFPIWEMVFVAVLPWIRGFYCGLDVVSRDYFSCVLVVWQLLLCAWLFRRASLYPIRVVNAREWNDNCLFTSKLPRTKRELSIEISICKTEQLLL